MLKINERGFYGMWGEIWCSCLKIRWEKGTGETYKDIIAEKFSFYEKKNQYTDNRSSVNSNRSNMAKTNTDNPRRETKKEGKMDWRKDEKKEGRVRYSRNISSKSENDIKPFSYK